MKRAKIRQERIVNERFISFIVRLLRPLLILFCETARIEFFKLRVGMT